MGPLRELRWWVRSRAEPCINGRMTVPLPPDLVALLRRPSPCFVATLMPDGSPQLTETWVTTDGQNVVLNIVGGMQKERNLRRDPRVSVNIVDPDNVNPPAAG